MLDAIARLASSKEWHYFWLGFSLVFMVIDLVTGSFFYAILMAVLAVFWAYQLKTINAGTNTAYNRYHVVKN